MGVEEGETDCQKKTTNGFKYVKIGLLKSVQKRNTEKNQINVIT